MRFTSKKIKRPDGSTELRLSFVFRQDELDSLGRIPDDPNVHINNLRTEGDVYQKSDWYLLWLRNICHWVNIWNERDNFKAVITESVAMRKKAQLKSTKRKRR